MADTIICPVCGESNPADMEFCQNCQSRLLPLTGPLKGEDAPLHPGQIPTKKVTSELEPILPGWLREARKQARQSAQEEPTISGGEKTSKPVPDAPDLLAGLASQNEGEEDDTPDWLTSITGAPAKKKKSEPESSQVKWVELGHNDEPNQAATADNSQSVPWKSEPSSAPDKDELTEWFKQASASTPAPAPAPDEKLEFIKGEVPLPSQQIKTAPLPPTPPDIKVSNVFKDLDANTADAFKEQEETAPAINTETPDWIKKLDAETPAVSNQVPAREDTASSSNSTNIPDWLKNLGQESAVSQQPVTEPDSSLPDWLKSTGSSTKVKEPFISQPPKEEPAEVSSQPVPDQQPVTGELPDWITSLKSAGPQAPVSAEPAVSAFQPDEAPSAEPASPAPASSTSAFTETPESSSDVDAIFASMQIPDWLSDVTLNKPAAEENVPPAAQAEEPIAPAELPSWVQAMRPVESAMSDSSANPQDTRFEEQGALAGLQGVLPIIPGAVAATSKPKSHSIKLDTTDQQQAHVALLEQILSAETAPVPMKTEAASGSQRVLRWSLSALLIFVLGGIIFARTQIFPLPGQVPNETISAIQAVEAIPPDAPVLVVFDYEPATIGEMEASGASLVDHMIILKHPRLTLLSTSPTGAALAERFMSNVLANAYYKPQAGVNYINLGYLPGGLAGVYDFALNPVSTMPLGADSTEVWNSAVLQGVTHLSDFASVIVLTDSVESGRTWIEQTALARGKTPLIMISSAQAGPMFLPYVESGQINGLINGLYGAAGAEQANGGLPSVGSAEQANGTPSGFIRRYWDAYSLGLLLVVGLITMGGLWNFWLGIRDRRAQEAG
jgi:hypothetical protein